MENNLYYTPTIEEFHVGFEFEKYDNRVAIYSNYPKESTTTNWHKFKYDLTSIRLSQLGTHLYSKTIRIKYLDQSDIESLGWKFENTKNSFFTKKNLNTYKIVKESGFNTGTTYTLEQLDNNLYLISSESYSSYGGETYKMVFNLNNKSELIKLMQQLNINNNVKEF